jgi:hypothetical protein
MLHLKKLTPMPNEVAVIDPLGKTIHLLHGVLFSENEAEGIYDDAAAVIEKPALLVEVHDNNVTELYYFRSIGWNKTLLIIARWNNDRWEADHYIKNPSSETLSAILKKGNQLI